MKILRCPSCGSAVIVDEQHFEPSEQLECAACHFKDYGFAYLSDYQHARLRSGVEDIRSLLSNMELIVNNGEIDHFSGRNIDQFIRHQAKKYGLSHHIVFELLNMALLHRNAPLYVSEEVNEALSHIYCVELIPQNNVSVNDLLDRIEQVAQQFNTPSQSAVREEEAVRMDLNSLRRQLEKKDEELNKLISCHKKLIEMNKQLKKKLSEYE